VTNHSSGTCNSRVSPPCACMPVTHSQSTAPAKTGGTSLAVGALASLAHPRPRWAVVPVGAKGGGGSRRKGTSRPVCCPVGQCGCGPLTLSPPLLPSPVAVAAAAESDAPARDRKGEQHGATAHRDKRSPRGGHARWWREDALCICPCSPFAASVMRRATCTDNGKGRRVASPRTATGSTGARTRQRDEREAGMGRDAVDGTEMLRACPSPARMHPSSMTHSGRRRALRPLYIFGTCFSCSGIGVRSRPVAFPPLFPCRPPPSLCAAFP
jgi:hypothetical protein